MSPVAPKIRASAISENLSRSGESSHLAERPKPTSYPSTEENRPRRNHKAMSSGPVHQLMPLRLLADRSLASLQIQLHDMITPPTSKDALASAESPRLLIPVFRLSNFSIHIYKQRMAGKWHAVLHPSFDIPIFWLRDLKNSEQKTRRQNFNVVLASF